MQAPIHDRPHRTRRRMLRLASRIVGGVSASFWVTALVLSTISDPPPEAALEGDATLEGVVLSALVAWAAAGVVLAFFNPRVGGLLTLGAGMALSGFALVTAGRNHLFAMLVSGVPFIVAGVLFLASWRDSRPA